MYSDRSGMLFRRSSHRKERTFGWLRGPGCVFTTVCVDLNSVDRRPPTESHGNGSRLIDANLRLGWGLSTVSPSSRQVEPTTRTPSCGPSALCGGADVPSGVKWIRKTLFLDRPGVGMCLPR